MGEAMVQAEIEAPVDALWALVSDFGEVGWMQGVTKVEVLEFKDDDARRLGYAIPANVPLPVDDYHATCAAVDLGNGRSRLDWGSTYTAKGMDDASAQAQVEAMYSILITWVKAELKG